MSHLLCVHTLAGSEDHHLEQLSHAAQEDVQVRALAHRYHVPHSTNLNRKDKVRATAAVQRGVDLQVLGASLIRVSGSEHDK